ncbi:MAG: ABC transporter substrate-binding protein [Bacillales bacterium]|nr:ABC transporter substrate-binding protein [Bacillales bacterium]
MKKTLKYVLASAILVGTLGSLASCGYKRDFSGNYTYNTFTAVSPSNWNELTYQDANDTQIMSYIGSPFFQYDYEFDKDGVPVPGKFVVKYGAATALEDVTVDYAKDDKYDVPDDATNGYAYKITLRKDLKWDDGTAITAEDFVYTMKEQLNPDFKHYRADSYYNGSTVIHNARAYVYQGSSVMNNAELKHATWEEGKKDAALKFDLTNSTIGSWIWGDYAAPAEAKGPAYVLVALGCEAEQAAIEALVGKSPAEIEADPALKAAFDAVVSFWKSEPEEELSLFAYQHVYPALDFDAVGIFAGKKSNELYLVLDNPLELLKEDGSLSYKAAYNMSSLPLVKKDVYEANKVAPVQGSTLWTSTYNSSVNSTASWGPYKLTSFQAGKEYILERNTNWYGYGLKENDKKYQTSRIVCETIKEWNSAWLKFQNGELDSIGIDVSIAQDYKNSSQAIFTPDDYVGSMQIQSSVSALKSREKDGVNKTILADVRFRKAISLSVNRDEYNQTCTTSSKAGYGLFNSMHYYDVENGGVYRNEDVAKKVLCDVYGVDVSKYDSLDAAAAAVTGYDPAQAKELVTAAYNDALEAGTIKDTDKVVITFGSGADNEAVRRVFDYLTNALKAMVVGTPLAGKLETEFEDHGAKWADDFRSGAYDICTGGWQGAAWDPGYFLLAYLSPDYMYSVAWETDKVQMTYTVLGQEYTMSLIEWYNCLNGVAGAAHNWAEGQVANDVRLGIIAALEKEILSVYYTVPLQNYFSASLKSYKSDYISRDYNTFMAYGGIEYLTYAYDDAAWEEYCKNNVLDYKA